MVYLYAGLGIAMISGIAAMFQIGTNMNKLSPLSSLKFDAYTDQLPAYDRQIMKLLYTQAVPDSNICSYIKNSIDKPTYEDGNIFPETLKQTYSKDKFFADSCVLVSNQAKHRVLIIPKIGGDYKYGFFSCSINKKPYCDFETNIESEDL
jgi:hypothetical protein